MQSIPPQYLIFATGLALNGVGLIVNGAWTILNYRMEQRQDRKLDEKLGAFEGRIETRFQSIERRVTAIEQPA